MIKAALLFYGEKKILDSSPVPLRLEKDNDPRLLTSPLKFPGKLEVDVLNNRLFISDSNHNRIVGFFLFYHFVLHVQHPFTLSRQLINNRRKFMCQLLNIIFLWPNPRPRLMIPPPPPNPKKNPFLNVIDERELTWWDNAAPIKIIVVW